MSLVRKARLVLSEAASRTMVTGPENECDSIKKVYLGIVVVSR